MTGPVFFPGYISLGSLESQECRTTFIPPALQTITSEKQQLARCLFERMIELADTNNLADIDKITDPNDPKNTEILRITPSCYQKDGLTTRAIPFYYKDNVIEKWNCSCIDNSLIPHYEELTDNPLLCSLDSYDFFRVEGHIGMEAETAIDKLEQLRKDLNIPFDIKMVRIGLPEWQEFDENTMIEYGEMNEVYLNTRDDLLCKEEELQDNDGNLPPKVGNLFNRLKEPTIVSLSTLYKDDIGQNLQDKLGPLFEMVKNSSIYSNDPTKKVIIAKAGEIILSLLIKYEALKQELEEQVTFHGFAKKHLGLEHLGGVPKGGTLVLGYVWNIINKSLFKQNFGISQQPERSDEMLIQSVLLNPDYNQDSLNSYLQKTITADFCLPYLCCSDAPVIRHEIKHVQPGIFVRDTVYCVECGPDDNDPTKLVIKQVTPVQNPKTIVSPAEGIFNIYINGNNQDIPSGLLLGSVNSQDLQLDLTKLDVDDFENGELEIKLEYIVGGQQATETLTVYKKPNLQFSVLQEKIPLYDENGLLSGFEYTLELEQEVYPSDIDPTTFYLNVFDKGEEPIPSYGLGLDPTDTNPVKVIKIDLLFEDSPGYIGLTAKKGICESNEKHPIDLCSDIPLNLLFCKNLDPIVENNIVTGFTKCEESELSSIINLTQQISDPPDPTNKGYIEIVPDLPGLNLEITNGFGWDFQFNADNLIIKWSPPNNASPRYFLIYHWAIIDLTAQGFFENLIPPTQLANIDFFTIEPMGPPVLMVNITLKYTFPTCTEVEFSTNIVIEGPLPQEPPGGQPVVNEAATIQTTNKTKSAKAGDRKQNFTQQITTKGVAVEDKNAYTKAISFANTKASSKASTWDNKFTTAINALATAHKDTKSKKLKAAYQAVLQNTLYIYLDHLVSRKETNLSTLNTHLEKMKALTPKVVGLKKEWNAEELQKDFDTKIVENIEKLLK